MTVAQNLALFKGRIFPADERQNAAVDDYRDVLKANLLAAMEARGVTPLTIKAHYLDGTKRGERLSPRSIRYYLEKDGPAPGLDAVAALASALGIEVHHLLTPQFDLRQMDLRPGQSPGKITDPWLIEVIRAWEVLLEDQREDVLNDVRGKLAYTRKVTAELLDRAGFVERVTRKDAESEGAEPRSGGHRSVDTHSQGAVGRKGNPETTKRKAAGAATDRSKRAKAR